MPLIIARTLLAERLVETPIFECSVCHRQDQCMTLIVQHYVDVHMATKEIPVDIHCSLRSRDLSVRWFATKEEAELWMAKAAESKWRDYPIKVNWEGEGWYYIEKYVDGRGDNAVLVASIRYRAHTLAEEIKDKSGELKTLNALGRFIG